MDAQKLPRELEENTTKLLNYLETVDEAILAQRPAPDSWSILEIFEHIIIIDQAINMMFNAPTESVERKADEKISSIEQVFNNYDRQYPAAEAIFPRGTIKDKTAVREMLSQTRGAFLKTGNETDWHAECKAFKHFRFGYMTRLEWAYFSIIHANRHIVQMQKAEKALT